MARYALSLPVSLKQEAETCAAKQGVSLNQFILWAVAEKVGALNQLLDDPAFPRITYRRGTAGVPRPVIRGTAVRVQTLVVATKRWGLGIKEVAAEYGLATAQVDEALTFYEQHRAEIDAAVTAEEMAEPGGDG